MINVGDKFTGIYGRKEVVTSIWLNDKTVGVESGLAYSYEEVYKSWYQQQKQRADELERKLNKEVEDGYQMENRWRTEIERADQLEKRWSALRESVIHMPCNQVGQISPRYIFDIMHDLEEDGE